MRTPSPWYEKSGTVPRLVLRFSFGAADSAGTGVADSVTVNGSMRLAKYSVASFRIAATLTSPAVSILSAVSPGAW